MPRWDARGQLAAQFQAQLTILHATPDWTLFSRYAAAHQAQYADISRNAEELLRDEVNSLSRQFGLTTVRGQINQDRATVAITRAIDSFQPDLLVLGAGGEHIGSDTVLGGTALKLISRVNVPLLLVRDPAAVPYSSTLAAIGDEVVLAQRLVHWAALLAGSGACHVVRAYDAPYANRMRLCRYGDAAIAQSAAEQRQIAERACDALEKSVQAGTPAHHPHRPWRTPDGGSGAGETAGAAAGDRWAAPASRRRASGRLGGRNRHPDRISLPHGRAAGALKP